MAIPDARAQQAFETALQDQADLLDIIDGDITALLSQIPVDEIIDELLIDLSDSQPAIDRLLEWFASEGAPVIKAHFQNIVNQAVSTAAQIGD
jgi:hypothetical protein